MLTLHAVFPHRNQPTVFAGHVEREEVDFYLLIRPSQEVNAANLIAVSFRTVYERSWICCDEHTVCKKRIRQAAICEEREEQREKFK